MNSLGIVIKIVERCNLNCSYCYFFNGLDQTYKKRPIFLSTSNIVQITKFLIKDIRELNIEHLIIGLHGGEPLMYPFEDFIYLIEYFKQNIPIKIDFTLQTNATLITKKWIDIFNLYNIGVGISVDGPEDYHNKYRVDHYNNGSHSLVERGIKLLQDNLISKPASLTVINPEFDGSVIYKYLIDLGFEKIDFLLPDYSHDNPPLLEIDKYGRYLKSIIDEWLINDSEKKEIRILQSIFNQLLGAKSLIYGFGNNDVNTLPFISIRSDGEITPTDELMSTDPESIMFINKNIFSNTLKEVLDEKVFDELKEAANKAPPRCNQCCWYKACGAGSLVSRFSKTNRFNNHSVFCEALKDIIVYQTNYLIKSGIKFEIIKNNLLGINN